MDDNARLVKGAGQAFLGRLGALLEAGSIIVFAWAYGAATFGLFAVLWSYVKVLTAVCDFAMTTSLQRFVPIYEGRENDKSAAIAGFALVFSGILSTGTAVAVWIAAPALAGLINASGEDTAHLTSVIKLYVWVLPFWTLVEVGTSAIRARRTFGPEIRIRIFYEQAIRLIAAVIFASLDLLTYGLFLAHLISVTLSAALALRLVARSYGMKALTNPRLDKTETHEILTYASSIMPANIVKKLFSELPIMLLNIFLPGAAGASAGGYYSLARKIASALQVIRLTFDYVMAPLASEKMSKKESGDLKEMIIFSTKLAVTFALPLGIALIGIRGGILEAMPQEFNAASTAILILVCARVFEAASGPASAIIEATGHRLLPSINGLAGLVVLVFLAYFLIPEFGVTGAAIAAAIGLNITAWAAFTQSCMMYRFIPYRSRHQGALYVAILSGLALLTVTSFTGLSPLNSLYVMPVWLVVTLYLQVRYGFSKDESKALGRISNWAKYGTVKKAK